MTPKYRLMPLSILLLFTACTPTVPPAHYAVAPTAPSTVPEPPKKPKAPLKPRTLHKVEDDNFDPDYMYLGAQSEPSAAATSDTGDTLPSVDKTECLSLMGEAKFTHYTEMLGSEAAALKRCAMLKAMP